mmetsp:Transcript_74998/g.242572  ORF Transcript_74998/g.242572 Transcript_74998/m.242572 type:complete len:526 (-) Transcript_74998:42-1619(-)
MTGDARLVVLDGLRVLLHRRDAELQRHVHELLEGDCAIGIRVVLLEESLNALLVHVLESAAELARGSQLLFRGHLVRHRHLARCHALVQVLEDRLDKLLGREARGPREVAGALARAEGRVHRLLAVARPPEDVSLVRRVQHRRMLHGAEESDNHAERVHRGVLAAQVGVPQVRDRPVGGLEFLDQASVGALADQIRGDEAGAAVHLRDLVREHVAIVVVASHAKAAAGPTDDLHGGSVADQVLQVTTCFLQQAARQVLFLVVLVEDLLHLLPETLLPLEDRFLGDDIRHDVRLQAAREEDVCQVLNVVQRVVVHDDSRLVVLDLAAVDDDRRFLDVIGEKGRQDAALADGLPAGAVLAADGVALEEDGLVEAEFDAGDVDGVARDGDAVPAATHGSVGRATRLLEAKLLNLLGAGRDGGLLEDGPNASARSHGLVQHLVIRVIAGFTAQVEVLPLRSVDERRDPGLLDDFHRVPRHLFARDVRHRRGHDLARGEGADPQLAACASPLGSTQGAQHGCGKCEGTTV